MYELIVQYNYYCKWDIKNKMWNLIEITRTDKGGLTLSTIVKVTDQVREK